MTPEKRKKLKAKGWVFSSPEEFLDLSEPEAMAVEVKLTLDNASNHDGSKG